MAQTLKDISPLESKQDGLVPANNEYPFPHKPDGSPDLEGCVQRYGELERRIDSLVSTADDRIAEIRSTLVDQTEPLEKERVSLLDYLKVNLKPENFPNGSKTIKLAAGEISKRSSKAVSVVPTVEEVLKKNRLIKFEKEAQEKFGGVFLKMKLEVSKSAIQANASAAKKLIGAKIEEKETLSIKPAKTEIQE
ncbi:MULTISPECIES: host-nuclease inhibitor Gam family protein [Leptospira]|uniref:Gam-like protein n=3 Tax=Leptospira interrogans TaxID=173 RepID=A0AAQ0AZW9_LEPIR|nr:MULTISPECIES: host-nuclease inhibitor Gam family protein [Leptospira]EMN93891.1 Gam-like protein [Leptospira interrogans serovar Medanensis str. UT053]EMN99669.1 Gam-like protein [Leptospira interrogans serovar Pomona str. UT364]KAK2618173.1 host-nuclease inhibitor Gam family protein [Leptospira interrogans]MCL8267225.1 host-nuclease inhibitor Gam family protein [Leptospira weilii]QOI43344.1 Gam-like protein [Leptospira interrogans serovar Canicola]